LAFLKQDNFPTNSEPGGTSLREEGQFPCAHHLFQTCCFCKIFFGTPSPRSSHALEPDELEKGSFPSPAVPPFSDPRSSACFFPGPDIAPPSLLLYIGRSLRAPQIREGDARCLLDRLPSPPLVESASNSEGRAFSSFVNFSERFLR